MAHRLMILGSMDEFVRLVECAKARGIYTIVCDGYTDSPAKDIADSSFDIDVRQTEDIALLCKNEQVDGIITSFSDLLAECMVDIANRVGLHCYCKPEQFKFLREKPLMKKMFEELRIATPRSTCIRRKSISADAALIGFPCVVKPVNGYGSRGIYVMQSEEEIKERFEEIVSYSSFDYILAEEYNDGYEFNMMSWVVDGEPIVLSIADREKSKEIPFAIPHVSRCAYPSRLIDDVYDEAMRIAGKVAAYVGIDNGPLSMQFFYSGDKGIQVCEVAGRLFGYEHELVMYAGGLSIEDLLLDYVYDQESLRMRLKTHSPFFKRCSAGLYFHSYEGVVASVDKARECALLPGVEEALIYYSPLEVVRHEIGAKPYAVRYYITADSREELDSLSEKLFRDVDIVDDAGNTMLYHNQMTSY